MGVADNNSMPPTQAIFERSEGWCGSANNVVLPKDVGHTQEAKKELIKFVKYEDTDNVLDTVKPTRLLRRILQLATTPSTHDIVIDFFGGSCTTGHAVLSQRRC